MTHFAMHLKLTPYCKSTRLGGGGNVKRQNYGIKLGRDDKSLR